MKKHKMYISKQKYTILFSFFTGLTMPLVMSIFITLVNNGWNTDFGIYYIRTYFVSAAMAVPVTMVIMPVITKLFQVVFEVNQ